MMPVSGKAIFNKEIQGGQWLPDLTISGHVADCAEMWEVCSEQLAPFHSRRCATDRGNCCFDSMELLVPSFSLV
jgi:hypothetical protein